MKTLLGIFAILLVIVIVIFFSKNFFNKAFFSIGQSTSRVVINNQPLSLLVAKNQKDKEIGLSGRDSLPADMAMAFPFDTPDYYAFWMNNMKFSLDIVFLRNKHVVTIYKNVPNPKFPTDKLAIYKPQEPADLVLELNAGQSDKLGIKPGDVLNISL